MQCNAIQLSILNSFFLGADNSYRFHLVFIFPHLFNSICLPSLTLSFSLTSIAVVQLPRGKLLSRKSSIYSFAFCKMLARFTIHRLPIGRHYFVQCAGQKSRFVAMRHEVFVFCSEGRGEPNRERGPLINIYFLHTPFCWRIPTRKNWII